MHPFPSLPFAATIYLDVASVVDLLWMSWYLRWLAPYRWSCAPVPPALDAFARIMGWLSISIMAVLLGYLCGVQYAGWPL